MRRNELPSYETVRGHEDFQRLWAGSAISQLGSAVGMVALPVIAVTVVEASTSQVALLAALTAITTALLAFPLGSHVEFRRKRPVMITADIVRFACLASVPIAAFLHALTFVQLCVIAVVNASCQIAFAAAAQAHLKALVSAERLIDANSRLESTRWLSVSVGPSIAGVLIGFLTAVGSLVADARCPSCSARWRSKLCAVPNRLRRCVAGTLRGGRSCLPDGGSPGGIRPCGRF